MKRLKQVDRSHYGFKYLDKKRWASIWSQLDEVIKLDPESVLEIGPGPGVFKAVAKIYGVSVKTLDIADDLGADYVGLANQLPFKDKSFDVVCAFQMLEHLPYEEALVAFAEMVRVSKSNVLISLPDAREVWRYLCRIPKIGEVEFFMPKPFSPPKEHVFDGEHYWEINKRGYSLEKILNDFGNIGVLTKTFRVKENSYHRFLIFEVNSR